MTKVLFGLSGLGLLALIGLGFVGISSTQPALLIGGFFCAGPFMMFTLGAALGRASNEFSLVRKGRTPTAPTQIISRIERARTGESLS